MTSPGDSLDAAFEAALAQMADVMREVHDMIDCDLDPVDQPHYHDLRTGDPISFPRGGPAPPLPT